MNSFKQGQRQVKTKIVATLGPAADDLDTIRRMIRAGMNVARLNMSHGSHEEHGRRIELVREAAKLEDAVIAILVDLQGPRLRIGVVDEPEVELENGATFVLDGDRASGSVERVGIAYADQVMKRIEPGHRVLVADGRIELLVRSVTERGIETEVIEGGPLSSRKGINLPDTHLDIASPTDKDRRDVAFGLTHEVDWFALSFVADASQVATLQKMIADTGSDVPVVAKIERPEAVQNIREIAEQADGVMVARGDLALEIGAARVPVVQKHLIEVANQTGVPVVTATQMLESMIHEPQPTRAETSDVANAIYDGTDAVMLSGETAIGAYPVRAVAEMASIARATEEALPYRKLSRRGAARARRSLDGAISEAAVEIARRAKVGAIIAVTSSGGTARATAVHRPEMTLIGATHRRRTGRQLALVWGVMPISIGFYSSTDEMMRKVIEAVVDRGIVARDERVVITSGAPIGRPGTTNMIQVRQYGDWEEQIGGPTGTE